MLNQNTIKSEDVFIKNLFIKMKIIHSACIEIEESQKVLMNLTKSAEIRDVLKSHSHILQLRDIELTILSRIANNHTIAQWQLHEVVSFMRDGNVHLNNANMQEELQNVEKTIKQYKNKLRLTTEFLKIKNKSVNIVNIQK